MKKLKKKENQNRFSICKTKTVLDFSLRLKEVGRINAQEQLSYWIDNYKDLIFSICYKITENYFDAEDLTQDTFLSAYKNIARFDGKNEKAWLARIATNKCLDFKKRGAAGQIPTEDEFFTEIKARGNGVEQQCLQDMVQEELKQCCKSLKPPYDEVAEKYFYQEMSVEEISNSLQRNAKTVQTQIYRAKEMLRKVFGKSLLTVGREA